MEEISRRAYSTGKDYREMGEVIIRWQVMDVEAREIRNEKTILIFPITDFTDTITVKMFLRNEQVPEVTEHVKKGFSEDQRCYYY